MVSQCVELRYGFAHDYNLAGQGKWLQGQDDVGPEGTTRCEAET